MSHVFFKGGTLIDGNGGVMEDSGVLIHDDEIAQIGKASEANLPPDTLVQEIGGKVIMPGLIDAHVHLVGVRTPNPISASFTPPELLVGRALNDTKKLIEAGFTSVRDVGSHVALHVRNLIAEGEYEGPRIKASYKLLSQTGGHGDLHMLPPEFNSYGYICDGVAECRKAARTMFREGADFIKVCASGGVLSERDDPRSPQFTLEELEAIVYEAGAVGSYVAAMLDRDVILVPTMTITSLLVAHGSRMGLPESTLRKAQLLKQVHTQNLQKAYRAGVKIATGKR